MAVLWLLGSVPVWASDNKAAGFDGKWHVFFAVSLLVLAGIFFLLIRMDRRLKQLEKEEEPS